MDLNTQISELTRPIYIGNFTDLIGKFHNRGIIIESPSKLGTVQVVGHELKLVLLVPLFRSRFNITDPIKGVGQSLHGFTIDVNNLTISEYIGKLADIYTEVV